MFLFLLGRLLKALRQLLLHSGHGTSVHVVVRGIETNPDAEAERNDKCPFAQLAHDGYDRICDDEEKRQCAITHEYADKGSAEKRQSAGDESWQGVIDQGRSDSEAKGDGKGDEDTLSNHGSHRVNDRLNRVFAPMGV